MTDPPPGASSRPLLLARHNPRMMPQPAIASHRLPAVTGLAERAQVIEVMPARSVRPQPVNVVNFCRRYRQPFGLAILAQRNGCELLPSRPLPRRAVPTFRSRCALPLWGGSPRSGIEYRDSLRHAHSRGLRRVGRNPATGEIPRSAVEFVFAVRLCAGIRFLVSSRVQGMRRQLRRRAAFGFTIVGEDPQSHQRRRRRPRSARESAPSRRSGSLRGCRQGESRGSE